MTVFHRDEFDEQLNKYNGREVCGILHCRASRCSVDGILVYNGNLDDSQILGGRYFFFTPSSIERIILTEDNTLKIFIE